VHEQILRLEVSVDDGVRVQGSHCRAGLIEEDSGFFLADGDSAMSEVVAEVAVEGALHEGVEVEEVVEEAVDLGDVGVVDEHLDLELAHQLLLHPALHHLPLRHYLYRAHQPAPPLDR
jgi:hypothetical protein